MLVLPSYAVPLFALVLLLMIAGAVWRGTRS